ncbi:MAG: SCP2 sterol-binding domain-containing protein [Candidatus Hermodarchaeota archaeon]
MNARLPITSILENLEADSPKFVFILDKIINTVVNIMNNAEELKEELIGYDDIYQTYVTDANFNYWLEVSDGKLLYGKGVNSKALFSINFTKNIILQILKNQVSGTDAFMKGKIKVEGSLSQGFRYIKLFRLIEKYLREKNGK